MNQIRLTEIILYVRDQETSRTFYEKLLQREADVHVPGMTEFFLSNECRLGLMPNKGIAGILGDRTPHPDQGIGIPRCEVYLYVEHIEVEYENALKSGAKLISPISDRDWGDRACYFSDPDGHIIAYGEKMIKAS